MLNRSRLLTRFVLYNLLGALGAAAAWWLGVGEVLWGFNPVATTFNGAIAGVFLIGMALCAWRIGKTSAELDRAEREPPMLTDRAFAVREKKLLSRIEVVPMWANACLALGVLGTVVGLFMGTMEAAQAALTGTLQDMTAALLQFISGVGVALLAFGVSLVADFWLQANYQMLRTATVTLAGRAR
jgi:hypothetical protein